MARRSADLAGGRIAVLGALSSAGAHLRAALADLGIPGSRIELFGCARDAALLSEYDGEARLIQPALELDALAQAAVFVCESGHDEAGLARAAQAGTLVVDLSGSLAGAALLDPDAVRSGARLVAVPHPVSTLLAAILAPLDAALGVVAASAFVLRSAGDFGKAGLEELREQTIRLLRFESTPTEVFGRQLAFNVLPEHLLPGGEHDASRRIAGECRALLAAPDLRLTVSIALAPTFLGHAAALHVDGARGGTTEARAALAEVAGIEVAGDPDAGATLEAPEGDAILVARIDEPAPGTVRLWAVAGDAGAASAHRAMEAAAAAGIV